MRQRRWWAVGLAMCLACGHAAAWQPTDAGDDDLLPPPPVVGPLAFSQGDPLTPLATNPLLADQIPPDNTNTVYDYPSVPGEAPAVNNGAVHTDLTAAYFNRYVYRGVDHDTVSRPGNALNLTLDAKLSFDTGDWPHPFVGVFTNVYDSDPVSRFQEIRPYFGISWNLRPFLLDAGDTSYLFPNR